MGRLLERMIDAQARWAEPFGEWLHRWVGTLFRPIRPLKDVLHGTWLGHPLHAASTDLPIGILYAATVFALVDAAGWADLRQAAVLLLAGAVVLMLLSALSGLADYADTDGRARTQATVHATLMVLTVVAAILALVAAVDGSSGEVVSTVLMVVASITVTAGAYVGGHVVFALGNMVSRHAFRGAGAKWLPLELPADTGGELPEGRLVKAKLGINTLALIRQGDRVLALHDQCAHAGGPLSNGTIVGDAVQCPWHGSRFRLADGRLVRGPAVYDQPAYEVRQAAAGGWEARRAAS